MLTSFSFHLALAAAMGAGQLGFHKLGMDEGPTDLRDREGKLISRWDPLCTVQILNDHPGEDLSSCLKGIEYKLILVGNGDLGMYDLYARYGQWDRAKSFVSCKSRVMHFKVIQWATPLQTPTPKQGSK